MALIKIKPNEKMHKIEPFIYGHFIEHLGTCIENGIWSYKKSKVPFVFGRVRENVFNAIKDIRPTILRWPGGCFSDTYHWKNGIGDLKKRPLKFNKAWGFYGPLIGPLERNHFGTDEFLKLCELLETEPYININLGSGTPKEASEWVEYCNSSSISKWGSLRKKNGRKEPYNVKYWGIGNEIFGFWETGYCRNGRQYGKKYLKFYNEMKKADKEIKTVAVGADNNFFGWNKKLLRTIDSELDFLSLHIYVPALNPVRTFIKRKPIETKESYYAIVSSSLFIENKIKWFWDTMKDSSSNAKIAFDEWNVWWRLWDLYRAEYYSMCDGIFTATVLNLLQRLSDKVGMANFAQLVNTIGLIITRGDDLFVTPSYLAFKLFRNYSFDLLVKSEVASETYSSKKLGCIPDFDEVPYLDCNATVNKKGDNLSIIVINRHFSDEIEAKIDLEGFEAEKECLVNKIESPSPFSKNSFEEPEKVKIEAKKINVPSNSFKYKFPAHSITNFTIKKAN